MHNALLAVFIGLLSCIKINAMLQTFEKNVHLQMNVERTNNVNRITLNCSSKDRPFGQSAEFLINNKTRANIRHTNGTCVINRGRCKKDECSCTDRIYVWSFIGHVDFPDRTYTCLFRFHQKKKNRHLLVYKTKTYDGSEISEEKTSIDQINISSSNSTTGATNSDSNSMNYVPIYICVCIVLPLVISAVPLSLLLRFKYCKGHDHQADKDISTLAEGKLLPQDLSPEIDMENSIPTYGNNANISNCLNEDGEHSIGTEVEHDPDQSVELQPTDGIPNCLNSSYKSNGFYTEISLTEEEHSLVNEAGNIADPSGVLKTANGIPHSSNKSSV